MEDDRRQGGRTPGRGAGATVGVGSLPHRNAREAAEFAVTEFDVATIPSLPRRSSAETMVAQAVGGVVGFGFGQYGSLTVDARAIDPEAPVVPDLASESFTGFRRFLAHVPPEAINGIVKWQFIGPVTLATALARVGVPAETAGELARRVVSEHLRALHSAVVARYGEVDQIVVLDEPSLGDVFSPDHLLDPETAADMLSSAMAVVETSATTGVHCCGEAPLRWVLSAGPQLLSIPATSTMLETPGAMVEFIERGGRVVWGIVPTGGPLPASALRLWRELTDRWCTLVRLGADPVELREQAMISPACGLGLHAVDAAERVTAIARSIGRRVHEQATLSRLTFGA